MNRVRGGEGEGEVEGGQSLFVTGLTENMLRQRILCLHSQSAL